MSSDVEEPPNWMYRRLPGPDSWTGVPLPTEFQPLFRFINHRINDNKEAQIMITGRNTTRGVGKTHAGVAISKEIHSWCVCDSCGYIWFYATDVCPRCETEDPDWQAMPEWSHNEHAFYDAEPFEMAGWSKTKVALLFEEIETAADARRAMSKENKTISDAMQTLRARNNVLIATLPTRFFLDKRVRQLMDVWINVQERGIAYPHFKRYNDYTGKWGWARMRLENGWETTFRWDDLSGDPDVEALARRKRDEMAPTPDQLSDEAKEAERKARERVRIQYMENALKVLDKDGATQTDLAEGVFEMSAGWGSRCNRGRLPQQDGDDEKYPIR